MNTHVDFCVMRHYLFGILLLSLTVARFSESAGQMNPANMRLRGAMIPTFASVADLRDLAALGANHVRWQLMWEGFPSYRASHEPLANYSAWLETALRHVDTMLPHCRSLGLYVVLDLHTPPGGQDSGGHWQLFQHRDYQNFFAECWRQIAARYRGNNQLWGFDLMNEPSEAGRQQDSAVSWAALAQETATVIRLEDSTRRIIVEAPDYGSSRNLVASVPLPLRQNVVYSFHMYDPAAFTHQGLFEDKSPVAYPGKVWGTEWNRRTVRRWLRNVRMWQKKYDVPIYVGEFSAVRWAPGRSAYYYLRDCIRTFEKYEWSWAYHAWREADVWSVEHGADRADTQPSNLPTERMELLRKSFRENAKKLR